MLEQTVNRRARLNRPENKVSVKNKIIVIKIPKTDVIYLKKRNDCTLV